MEKFSINALLHIDMIVKGYEIFDVNWRERTAAFNFVGFFFFITHSIYNGNTK